LGGRVLQVKKEVRGMKKMVLLLLVSILLTGCGANGTGVVVEEPEETPAPNTTIVIPEKMFATQVYEVYVNQADYIGKRIQIEGLYDAYGGYQFVYRRTNGCCGTDGTTGFPVEWDGEKPAIDDWIAVEGVLTEYVEGGTPFLRIKADKLEKTKISGKEFVTQ
jgi:uncharacterized membrane protein YcgQ (UPF0703/DUF1980 family)